MTEKEYLIFKELASAGNQFAIYLRGRVGIPHDEPRYVRFRRAISAVQKPIKEYANVGVYSREEEKGSKVPRVGSFPERYKIL